MQSCLTERQRAARCVVAAGAIVAALGLRWARADDGPPHHPPPQGVCVDISVPRSMAEKAGARWIELTRDQWRFMEGIYAMNPMTPAGLPMGDGAILIQKPGDDEGGAVFFVDGSRACSPMPVPKILIDMLQDLDEPHHEGSGT